MDQIHQIRWLPVYNSGAQEIPAFGLVEIAGATLNVPDRMYLSVKRPTADNTQPIAINSYQPIASGGYGLVTMEGPAYVYYDTADAPATGESYGTTADSFKATEGFGGLLIIGDAKSDRGLVLATFADIGKKKLCRFTADSSFTTGSEYVEGTITNQYGPGAPHSSTDITAYNLLRHDTTYEFYGDADDAGLAYWDCDDNWRIIMFECP
jgi:hypothetical protein